MRTYGRAIQPDGSVKWIEVDTDVNGDNSNVWVTTLIQCLKLELGESPFFAKTGIPARAALVHQFFPDFYVAQLQKQFAGKFAALSIQRTDPNNPVYSVSIVKNNGSTIVLSIAA